MSELKFLNEKLSKLKHSIQFLSTSKIQKSMEVEVQNNKIKKFKTDQKRPSIKRAVTKIVTQESMFSKHINKRELDVLDYGAHRSKLPLHMIDPVVMVEIRCKHLQSQVIFLAKRIAEQEQEYETFKAKRIKIKSILYNCLDFMVKNPGTLHELGVDLQSCIIYNLQLDPSFKSERIGGEFTAAEKEYLFNSAKLKLQWNNVQFATQVKPKNQLDKLEEDDLGQYFYSQNVDVDKEMQIKQNKNTNFVLTTSNVVYPSTQYIKVIFLLKKKIC